ncbi:MAG: aldo/keto reductase [Chloroflexi bacterium]|nr:aldo/keto reductase [Chloroflexota bacterium]|tara:strand:+ start:3404 stop:4357 length:954 start_codon:yes stop_codon:yes gene_type:complete
MDPLKLNQISDTRIFVSSLGVGGAPFGHNYKWSQGSEVSADTVSKTISEAIKYGLNYFDTAPGYGYGQSERYYGNCLPNFNRSKFVISSKVGNLIYHDDKLGSLNSKKNYSKDGIFRSVEESLNRLKLDYLDIALVHDPDEHMQLALEESFPALLDLKSQGVVRSVGAGMNYCEPLIDFANRVDLDCFLVAGRYTLLDQSAAQELFPICLEKNISLILGGPYNSGILADPKFNSNSTYFYQKAPKGILKKARSINDICNRQNVPLKAAALQFGLMNSAVTSVIPGVRSVSEVIENFEMLSIDIDPQFWDELRFEGLI